MQICWDIGTVQALVTIVTHSSICKKCKKQLFSCHVACDASVSRAKNIEGGGGGGGGGWRKLGEWGEGGTPTAVLEVKLPHSRERERFKLPGVCPGSGC